MRKLEAFKESCRRFSNGDETWQTERTGLRANNGWLPAAERTSSGWRPCASNFGGGQGPFYDTVLKMWKIAFRFPAHELHELAKEIEENNPGLLSEGAVNIIIDIGRSLFGEQWQTDMARALNVSDRTVRRFVSGEIEPKPGLYMDLARIAQERLDNLGALLPIVKFLGGAR